ncbi:DUF6470 family protein [Paenibacillus albus]|uniref:Uncharacterized protein n=1 Tax=Paenibacillus albus TaxID=2495582 RepID=A0A3S8ZYJ4_9BACL|nr:DUF6470 family protein [Paenibacillus albus]AZN38525.1 hypothetical protein EJC50_01695 [Paenibacillus albus]
MKLPYIQAESQRALIGIETKQGMFDIHSKRADLDIKTTPTKISAPTPMPELNLNQDRMWAAFNGGKPVEFLNRIYSQMPGIALQGIAQIVERGNQMGDLRIKENPIPEFAYEAIADGGIPDIQYLGPATAHNVDIEFKITPPDIKVTPGRVDIQAQPNKPEIDFQRGGVSYSMQRYPSVSFSVAEIDLRV